MTAKLVGAELVAVRVDKGVDAQLTDQHCCHKLSLSLAEGRQDFFWLSDQASSALDE